MSATELHKKADSINKRMKYVRETACGQNAVENKFMMFNEIKLGEAVRLVEPSVSGGGSRSEPQPSNIPSGEAAQPGFY